MNRRILLTGKRRYIFTLPQYLLTSAGTVFEGFDTFADWTQTAGTIANDAVNFRTGTAALKLTTGSGTNAVATKTISKVFGSAPRMRLSFYLAEAYAQLASIQVRLTSAGGSFSKLKLGNVGRGFGFHTGWNTIDFYPSDWTDSGGEDWANTMNRLRVQAIPTSGQVANVSMDNLIIDTVGYPSVMLTFDDCLSSLYTTVFPNLKSKRMVGTAYCITANIGTAGYCTAAQMQEMAASGTIMVANHTSDHTILTGLAEADQETKISTAQTALAGWGISTGDHLAYPSGAWNEDTLTACGNLSMKTGRTAAAVAYPMVNSDQFLVLGGKYLINTDTLATATGLVDTAKSINTPFNLQFHDIVTTPSTTYQWSTSDFQALLDYFISQNIRTITCQEFYNTNAGSVVISHR